MNNLAKLHYSADDPAAAEPLYLRAVAIIANQGDGPKSTHAWLLHNLALFYQAQSRNEEARGRFEEALGIYARLPPSAKESSGNILNKAR